uniref:DNA repair protein REV1 n=1 Tax=Scleropages formosus TaxID=113540 RepID=A0A8C9VLU8_SCLFO
MAAKVSKLEEQFKLDAPREKQKEGTSSTIFRGVAIYVNGLTDPSADELRRLMMLHGGQFHVYYSRSKTTHIIATNLPHSKVKELRGEKVVRPDWITDSIKAGHLLSYLQYQLYAKQKHWLVMFISKVRYLNVSFVLDCNSCHRNGLDQTAGLRLNGIQEEESEDETLHPAPVFSSGALVERTLTNGHSHPPNGALKPLDLTRGQTPMENGPHQPPVLLAGDKCAGESAHLLRSGNHLSVTPVPTARPSSRDPEHPGLLARGAGRVWLNGAQRDTAQGAASPPCPPVDRRPADADIISEFYSRSRLHHISTWKSEFSEYVSSLQHRRHKAGGVDFPGRERLRRQRAARIAGSSAPSGPPIRQPCILHVDMDCFFVSVGIRHRPDLNGKPVAVTSNRGQGRVSQRQGANCQLEMQYYQRKLDPKRKEVTPSPESPDGANPQSEQDLAALSMAEVASCSYEARQAGVRNGMFFGQAKQLCPGLQAVPYDFQAYKEVAMAMYQTLASYTHHIEALSCDEALVDATRLLKELGVSPEELAGAIRADVKERTGCSASVGMGSNILLARMATRKAKPDGQYYLKSEEVDDFIRDQAVGSLPGVGRTMSCKLASLGVQTCGDLQQISMSRLQKEFGPRTGQTLFRFCRGLDDRPVRSEKERKSVSAGMNYGIRFTQVAEAESFLTKLSQEVQRRLQAAGLKGRRITLKLMMRKPGAPVEPAKYGGHGICDTFARTVSLDQPTDSAQHIATEVIKLFHAMKLNVMDMRGVGLQVQQLTPSLVGPAGTAGGTGAPRRSIRDMLAPGEAVTSDRDRDIASVRLFPPPSSAEPVPGTSKGGPAPRHNGGLHTPRHLRTHLDLSIEVPSPSQVDRSVLEALPPELREQVEHSWRRREELAVSRGPLQSAPSQPLASPPGTLVLHVPEQQGQGGPAGIVLALPDFSQVDPEVFAALPLELQEELRSAYRHRNGTHPQGTVVEAKNPLLQLKQVAAAGRTKRRYKRKNASPAKGVPSPLKSRLHGNSPAKSSPAKSSPAKRLPYALKQEHAGGEMKLENGPSTSSLKPDAQEKPVKLTSRPGPTLAGACEFTDIRTLLKEWVTSIPEPMEDDILQVVKYCTELVEDRDLEKLYLVIKYMKRLMQQSVESVWSMAFDFILDNVQVVVQQTYGSTLKIT